MADRHKLPKEPHNDDIQDLAYAVLLVSMIGGFFSAALALFLLG